MAGWLASTAKRIQEVYKWEGASHVLWRGCRKILSPVLFWEITHLFEADLSRPIPAVSPKGNFVVKICSGQGSVEHVQAALCPTRAVSTADIEDWLKRGDIVAVIYSGDEVAGFSWLTWSSPWVPEFHGALVVRAQEVVQHNNFVVPDWRGRGIQGFLAVALSEFARARGCVRMLTYVDALNTPSLKTQYRLGTRRVLTVVCVYIGGLSRPWCMTFGIAPTWKTRWAANQQFVAQLRGTLLAHQTQ